MMAAVLMKWRMTERNYSRIYFADYVCSGIRRLGAEQTSRTPGAPALALMAFLRHLVMLHAQGIVSRRERARAGALSSGSPRQVVRRRRTTRHLRRPVLLQSTVSSSPRCGRRGAGRLHRPLAQRHRPDDDRMRAAATPSCLLAATFALRVALSTSPTVNRRRFSPHTHTHRLSRDGPRTTCCRRRHSNVTDRGEGSYDRTTTDLSGCCATHTGPGFSDRIAADSDLPGFAAATGHLRQHRRDGRLPP